MDQPGDAVIHHDLSEVLVVQDVGVYERPLQRQRGLWYKYTAAKNN